jgi:FkbM family methyltransferase
LLGYVKRLLLRATRGNSSNGQMMLKGGWPAQLLLPPIDVLIDVGVGHQGTPGLYKNFDSCNFVFIDPLAECRKAVELYLNEHEKNIFIECALGENNEHKEINVSNSMLSRSSFDKVIPVKADAKDQVSRRLVEVCKMDDIEQLQNAINEKRYGIKIDVEGHEALVIKGGKKTIRKSQFVILEMSVGPKRFSNELFFHEYIILMKDFGFVVHSIRMGKGGGQGHCDVAFVKK